MKFPALSLPSLRMPSLPPLLRPRFTRAEWIFSLKAFAGAMLAVCLASWAGQPHPFWAMMTAYIVANPMAGAVRSKAVFRFCGTLVGGTAAVLLVPRFAHAPELLSLALALWVAGCLTLSLHDRTPRAYAFMLAGYTAALIGFPSVDAPSSMFDTAVARVEEIGLGVLCATLVHSLVWPTSLATSVLGLLDRTLGDTRGWLTDIVSRRDGRTDRRRVAGDITQLRLLSTHIPFDTGHLRWTAEAVHAMQDRVAALTPLLGSIEDRLQALEAHGGVPEDVQALLDRLGPWLALSAADAQAQLPALRAQLAALTGDAPRGQLADDPWARLLRLALAERLSQLLDGWLHSVQLRADIDRGLAGAAVPLRPSPAPSGAKLHVDLGMALWSGAAALIAILVCCAFWILTGWSSGSGAALMAAIFCCFYASMDDPVPAINGFLTWTLWSLPVGALFVLVVLPLVQDMWTLAVLCAPVFLVLGAFLGRPSTVGAALPFLFGVMGTLVMHDSAQADLTSFVNGTLAQLAGVFVASRVTRLMRSVGADWSARRIQRATWRELDDLARLPRSAGRAQAYLLRMLDRIALLAPRVAQAGGSVPGVPTDDALHDLRVGADLVALQGARGQLPGEVTLPLQPLLTAIGDWQRARIAGDAGAIASPPALLLDRLDTALARLVEVYPTSRSLPAEAIPAASALTGLRRNLFPQAPEPRLPIDAIVSPEGPDRSGEDGLADEMEPTDGSEPIETTDTTDTTASSGSSDLNKENPA